VSVSIGVPKESLEGERRVAAVPDTVAGLVERGAAVVVEAGAGDAAGVTDAAFEEAGAKLGDPWSAEILFKVAAPSSDELSRLRSGQVLVGFLNPFVDTELVRSLASAGVTSFAVEAIPRTTRAQSMDALSSQANVGGYMATIIAAREAGRFFPMLTTAAGTVAPARTLVLGAGVAGLQAIATAKRLGSVVTGFDVRSVVKEQVESLGGRFLEVEAVKDAEGEGGYARPLTDEENELLRGELGEAAERNDVIISTAQIPGRPAPLLITADAVRGMAPGSVIVDLAGESGGDCELSEAGQTVLEGGVKVIAPLNLPSEMAADASKLYAKNLQNLTELFVTEDGELAFDFEDEIVAGACITREGEIVNERAKEAAG